MRTRMRRRGRYRRNIPVGPIAAIPGVVMAVFVIIFGVFWTMSARSAGAPGIFTLFGIGFVVVAITGLASVVAAALKVGSRVTSSYEEEDPVVLYRPEPEKHKTEHAPQVYRECSYCGTRVDADENRCPNCGAGI